jgi:hypothetical protein
MAKTLIPKETILQPGQSVGSAFAEIPESKDTAAFGHSSDASAGGGM